MCANHEAQSRRRIFNDAAAMNNLDNCYGDAGRKELAIECFEKTLRLIAADPAMNESEKQSRQIIERKPNALKQQ